MYKWLVQVGIIKSDPKNHAVRNNGKMELDEGTSSQFWSGMKVGELLLKMDPSNEWRLKENNTPTARLFNWNLLTEKLKRVGVELDSDIKGLIVGGDLEMVSEVVKDIYDLQKQKGLVNAETRSPQRQQEFGITQQWDQQQKSRGVWIVM